ncbi:MAG: hypothetical protein QXW54_03925, partial [Candidatus Nitrosocaldus sp.]
FLSFSLSFFLPYLSPYFPLSLSSSLKADLNRRSIKEYTDIVLSISLKIWDLYRLRPKSLNLGRATNTTTIL